MRISFGTSGWRAIISDEFTFKNVKIVAQAIADYIKAQSWKERGIIVGYDTRFLSEKFAEAASSVLAGNGIPSYLTLRDTPTPVIAFEILRQKTAGAINITASHNPPEYNGIKYSPPYGGPALPETTQKIEERANSLLLGGELGEISLKEGREKGLIKSFDASPAYLEDLRSKIDVEVIRRAHLTIAIDLMYGTARGYLDLLLKEAGCKVKILHGERNPYFGGIPPEPAKENLSVLFQEVASSRAHLGLATDGDADRFGVIDSDGSYIAPNQVIALLFIHLLKTRGWRGGVARSVATTHLIDAIAKKYGIKVYETPVGFKFIGELLAQGETIIGGEESGGLSIKGHIPDKDGILACLLVAEMVASERKSLMASLKELYGEFGEFHSGKGSLHLPLNKVRGIIDKLKGSVPSAISSRKVVSTNNMDGIKYILDDGSWLIIRPSGTEPLVRYMAEAGSPKQVQELLEAGKKLLLD